MMKLSNRIAIIGLALVLTLILVVYCLFATSKSRTFQFFGELINHVDTEQKVVALTFDDTPSVYTDEVLNMLASKDVKATFYVIGQLAEKYPDQMQKLVNSGQEIGNHSFSHQRMILKTPTFIKDEIEQTNRLIRSAGYTEEITFRPPYGKKLFFLPWYLSQKNIKTIMCDVEPDTYFPGDAAKITDYTLNNTKPGSIILMHPFCGIECAADREALPGIIDGLKEKGFRFVTVGELVRVVEK